MLQYNVNLKEVIRYIFNVIILTLIHIIQNVINVTTHS